MQINKSNDSEVTEMHFKQEFVQRPCNFLLKMRECADVTTKKVASVLKITFPAWKLVRIKNISTIIYICLN